jgi:hypothetical protein
MCLCVCACALAPCGCEMANLSNHKTRFPTLLHRATLYPQAARPYQRPPPLRGKQSAVESRKSIPMALYTHIYKYTIPVVLYAYIYENIYIYTHTHTHKHARARYCNGSASHRQGQSGTSPPPRPRCPRQRLANWFRNMALEITQVMRVEALKLS